MRERMMMPSLDWRVSEAERAAAEENTKRADNFLLLVEDAIRTQLLTAKRRSFLSVGTAA
jgi:hypothetical protein